jgi:hypothetical protein
MTKMNIRQLKKLNVDLLESVKELLTFLPDGSADYETLRFARALVAKKKG